MPEPIVFAKELSKRCKICLSDEMSEWIRDSLKATVEVGASRPPVRRVHRELLGHFPATAPLSENSTSRHLTYHEPAWGVWDDEANS